VADRSTNYRPTDHWRVGIDVANLLDHEYYQTFGGAILRRRALARVLYS